MSDIAEEIFNDLEEDREESEDARQGTENETKAEKFKRLGSQRTSKILKMIKQLKNLSSSAYEYTPEDIEKIFSAIRSELEDAERAFKKEKKTDKVEFSL